MASQIKYYIVCSESLITLLPTEQWARVYCIVLDSQDFEGELHTQANTSRVGPIQLIFEPIKAALLEQCKSWKWAFGRALNERAAAAMSEILAFFDGLQTRLSRPIKDLDDIRGAMAALAELRDNEIRIDSGIPPIEETYALLNRFELVFSDGNAEKVDSLAYGWKKLRALADQLADELLAIQPKFKGDLVDGIVQFKEDLAFFLDDYVSKGAFRLPTSDALFTRLPACLRAGQLE